MSGQQHIIRTELLDMHFADCNATPGELQQQVLALFRDKLNAIIDEELSAAGDPALQYRFKQVVLDLGQIPYERLDEEMTQRLREAVRESMRALIREVKARPTADDYIVQPHFDRLELLGYFLLNGHMPWWFRSKGFSIAELFAQLIREQPRDLRQLLKSIGRNVSVVKRIVQHFEEELIYELIRVLEPSEASFIIAYARDLQRVHEKERIVNIPEKEFRKAKLEFILTYLLNDRGSYFNRIDFVRKTLRAFAAHYLVAYNELLGFISDSIGHQEYLGTAQSQLKNILLLLREEETQGLPIRDTHDENEYAAVMQGSVAGDEAARMHEESNLPASDEGDTRSQPRRREDDIENEDLLFDDDELYEDEEAFPGGEEAITHRQQNNRDDKPEDATAFPGDDPAGIVIHDEAALGINWLQKLARAVEQNGMLSPADEVLLQQRLEKVFHTLSEPALRQLVKALLSGTVPRAAVMKQLAAYPQSLLLYVLLQQHPRIVAEQIRQQVFVAPAVAALLRKYAAGRSQGSDETQAFLAQPTSPQLLKSISRTVAEEGLPVWLKQLWEDLLKEVPAQQLDETWQKFFLQSASRAQWIRLLDNIATRSKTMTRAAWKTYIEKEFSSLISKATWNTQLGSVFPAAKLETKRQAFIDTLFGQAGELAAGAVNDNASEELLVALDEKDALQLVATFLQTGSPGEQYAHIRQTYFRLLLAQLVQAHGAAMLAILSQVKDAAQAAALLVQFADPVTRDQIVKLLRPQQAGFIQSFTRKLNRVLVTITHKAPSAVAWTIHRYLLAYLLRSRQGTLRKKEMIETLLYSVAGTEALQPAQLLAAPLWQQDYERIPPADKKEIMQLVMEIGNNANEREKERLLRIMQDALLPVGEQAAVQQRAAALHYFLEYGKLPWWTETQAVPVQQGLLEGMLAKDQHLFRFIAAKAQQQPIITGRIIYLLVPDHALRVISAASGTPLHELQNLVSDLAQLGSALRVASFSTLREVVAALLRVYVEQFIMQQQAAVTFTIHRLVQLVLHELFGLHAWLDLKELLFNVSRFRYFSVPAQRKWLIRLIDQHVRSVTSTKELDEAVNAFRRLQQPAVKKEAEALIALFYMQPDIGSFRQFIERLVNEPARFGMQIDMLHVLFREKAAINVFYELAGRQGFYRLLAAVTGNERKVLLDDAVYLESLLYAMPVTPTMPRSSSERTYWINVAHAAVARSAFNREYHLEQLVRKLSVISGQGMAQVLAYLLKQVTGPAAQKDPGLQQLLFRLLDKVQRQSPASRLATTAARQSNKQPAQRNTAQQRRTEAIKKRQELSKKLGAKDEAVPLYVHNAGLVLMNPYLSRLFSMLQYTEQGQFKNDEAIARAVHLLEYAATARSKGVEEHELVLNKVICGLTPEHPMMVDIELAEHEKSTVDGLLKAMIANWEALKNTSIDGLRGSFLIRDGRLGKDQFGWTLAVEKKGYDVLLDRIPWNISTLKYTWMELPILVQWR